MNKVRHDIDRVFSSIESQIDDALSDAISGIEGVDFSAEDIKDTLSSSAIDTLSNQFAIPFGFDVNLTRNEGGQTLWSESVRLAVDQYPNYLEAFKNDTEY